MSESLIIEGKHYISARRAAEIAEYSNDYIGQLCRSGKLVCKMVGRFWYVDENSLRKHKEESFKANQTSFRVSGFSPKLAVVGNGTNSSNVSNPSIYIGSASTRSFIMSFKQVLFIFMTVIAVLVSGMTAVTAVEPFLPKVFSQNLSQALANNAADVHSTMNTAGRILNSIFDQTYSDIVSIVSPSSPLNKSEGDQSGNYSVANAGVVVVPQSASSTEANDVKLAQTITNSFSDNVTVTPGQNGTTGVITPEFRTVKGHDFLYVLVPVKTGSTSPALDGTSTQTQN